MKPVIGLMPLYDDDKESLWMLPGYMEVIRMCGGFPIMLPLTDEDEEIEETLRICSGFLFTGGHDVDPSMYGKATKEYCGITCRKRDQMECRILSKVLDRKLPIFGICRGIQLFNAYLGGELYQDLKTEYDSAVEHHMMPPYNRAVHSIDVLPDTVLSDILGAGHHAVNSYHHQAIRTPAPSVEVMAVSEDGLIEAISIKNQLFAVGVQWHPEFLYKDDKDSRKLVGAFVDACKQVTLNSCHRQVF